MTSRLLVPSLFWTMSSALVFHGGSVMPHRIVDASGAPTQLACVVTAKRQMARTLCFLDVAPVDAAEWRPRGAGFRGEATVQLIVGASLERSVGTDRTALAVKRLKVGQLLLVEVAPNWDRRRWRWFWSKELDVMRTQRRLKRLDLRCLSIRVLSSDVARQSPPTREEAEEVMPSIMSTEEGFRLLEDIMPTEENFLRLPEDVEVIVVDDATSTERFTAVVESLGPGSVVGVDTEWGDDGQATLAQFAIRNEVFVVDLSLAIQDVLATIPTSGATLVGFHIDIDLEKLDWWTQNVVDLRRRSNDSLNALSKAYLGKPLDKSLQRFPWSTRPLPQACIDYAALDAWVPLTCYDRFPGTFSGGGGGGGRSSSSRRRRRRRLAKTISFSSATLHPGAIITAPPSESQHPKDVALLALEEDSSSPDPVGGYDRRAGIVRVADASVLFVTFPPPDPQRKRRKYPNEISLVNNELRMSWWPPKNVQVEERFRAQEPAILFARLGTGNTAFFHYCGTLRLVGPLPGDRRGGLVLGLQDGSTLLERRVSDSRLDALLEAAGCSSSPLDLSRRSQPPVPVV